MIDDPVQRLVDHAALCRQSVDINFALSEIIGTFGDQMRQDWPHLSTSDVEALVIAAHVTKTEPNDVPLLLEVLYELSLLRTEQRLETPPALSVLRNRVWRAARGVLLTHWARHSQGSALQAAVLLVVAFYPDIRSLIAGVEVDRILMDECPDDEGADAAVPWRDAVTTDCPLRILLYCAVIDHVQRSTVAPIAADDVSAYVKSDGWGFRLDAAVAASALTFGMITCTAVSEILPDPADSSTARDNNENTQTRLLESLKRVADQAVSGAAAAQLCLLRRRLEHLRSGAPLVDTAALDVDELRETCIAEFDCWPDEAARICAEACVSTYSHIMLSVGVRHQPTAIEIEKFGRDFGASLLEEIPEDAISGQTKLHIKPQTKIPMAAIAEWFVSDLRNTQSLTTTYFVDLRSSETFAEWEAANPTDAAELYNVIFHINSNIDTLAQFSQFKGALKAANFERAPEHLLESKYAQVDSPYRVSTLLRRLRNLQSAKRPSRFEARLAAQTADATSDTINICCALGYRLPLLQRGLADVSLGSRVVHWVIRGVGLDDEGVTSLLHHVNPKVVRTFNVGFNRVSPMGFFAIISKLVPEDRSGTIEILAAQYNRLDDGSCRYAAHAIRFAPALVQLHLSGHLGIRDLKGHFAAAAIERADLKTKTVTCVYLIQTSIRRATIEQLSRYGEAVRVVMPYQIATHMTQSRAVTSAYHEAMKFYSAAVKRELDQRQSPHAKAVYALCLEMANLHVPERAAEFCWQAVQYGGAIVGEALLRLATKYCDFPPIKAEAAKYRVHSSIGQGKYGIVFHATHDDKPGEEFVAKKITRQFFDTAELRGAQDVPPHPSLITPLFAFPDAVERSTFVVISRFGGQSLADFTSDRQYFDDGAAIAMLHQISGALQTLHQAGVAHGDVHPGNLVYDHVLRHWSLIDLGLAVTATRLTIRRDYRCLIQCAVMMTCGVKCASAYHFRDRSNELKVALRQISAISQAVVDDDSPEVPDATGLPVVGDPKLLQLVQQWEGTFDATSDHSGAVAVLEQLVKEEPFALDVLRHSAPLLVNLFNVFAVCQTDDELRRKAKELVLGVRRLYGHVEGEADEDMTRLISIDESGVAADLRIALKQMWFEATAGRPEYWVVSEALLAVLTVTSQGTMHSSGRRRVRAFANVESALATSDSFAAGYRPAISVLGSSARTQVGNSCVANALVSLVFLSVTNVTERRAIGTTLSRREVVGFVLNYINAQIAPLLPDCVGEMDPVTASRTVKLSALVDVPRLISDLLFQIARRFDVITRSTYGLRRLTDGAEALRLAAGQSLAIALPSAVASDHHSTFIRDGCNNDEPLASTPSRLKEGHVMILRRIADRGGRGRFFAVKDTRPSATMRFIEFLDQTDDGYFSQLANPYLYFDLPTAEELDARLREGSVELYQLTISPLSGPVDESR